MKITKPQLDQIIKEELEREDIAEMINLLGQISKKLDKLDGVDASIDYLSAALTGTDPLTIQMQQSTGAGRRFAPRPAAIAESTKITKEQLKQIVKEELYVIQNGLDHESNFYDKMEEGDVVQGPWGGEPPEVARSNEKNAEIANKIESFVATEMDELYGNPSYWTDQQIEAFDVINELLNILFPSGE